MGNLIVDLNQLTYQMAYDIVEWCLKHDIETEKCFKIASAYAFDANDFMLEIPEKYVTFLVLKWS